MTEKEIKDRELANSANKLLTANRNQSRTALAKRLGVSTEKLNRLARLGLIENYPAPMTHSQASTHGRRMGNPWGAKFYLRGSPRNGVANGKSTN